MIEESKYRLGEYQISEYGDGVLWWHAHHGLGQQRNGKCRIIGDILVIGPSTHEENGYLKREFLGRLEKLPIWEKTKFYCSASELFNVAPTRSLSKDLSGHINSTGSVQRSAATASSDENAGVFRLGKYRVTVASNSRISWQALEGRDGVTGGQCNIQSGILFIGPIHPETREQNGQSFLEELKEIPPWTRTKVWGHSLALRPCEAAFETGDSNVMAQRGPFREHRGTGNPTSTLWKASKETLRLLWSSNAKFKIPSSAFQRFSKLKLRKPSQFPRGLRKIGFLILIPLLFVSLVFGLILDWHSVEETSHHHHASEKRHHR